MDSQQRDTYTLTNVIFAYTVVRFIYLKLSTKYATSQSPNQDKSQLFNYV